MILPAQHIRAAGIMHPCVERARAFGMTFGLGPAGFDVRIAESLLMWPGRYVLASTAERFTVPDDVLAIVHDNSTWARLGLTVQNTVVEPGWRGVLTLEISLHALRFIRLRAGMPIAQIVFHRLEAPTDRPYSGRYQDQRGGPQKARFLSDREDSI